MWSVIVPLILKYGPALVTLIQQDAPAVEKLFSEIMAAFKQPHMAANVPVTAEQIEPLFVKALKK